jgi:hypothetical protein
MRLDIPSYGLPVMKQIRLQFQRYLFSRLHERVSAFL